MSRRVVITGMGILSPLGRGLEKNWDMLMAGQSGIGPITSFDTTDYPAKIAGIVPEGQGPGQFWPDDILSPKEQRHVDRFVLFGMCAAQDAMMDSGFVADTDQEKQRAGVVIGSGIGGLRSISAGTQTIINQGPRRLTPFFIPSAIINMISGHVSVKYGLQGPNTSITTACATGTHAIGDAMRLIREDYADVMLAGGAEAAICPEGVAGFSQARALSTKYNETPTKASRPWDKDRDGFVMGEGAGVLVLEEYEHAKRRGAKIYAEVVGYGLTGDAYHITLPGGNGGLRAMQNAIKSAGLNPEQIDYINAHGTSTPAGDLIEFNAVKTIFGDAPVAMSSTKSATGHLLGAAGAIEAIYAILSMQNGAVPPTLNLDNPEEETAGFNLVPFKPQEKTVNVVLSNSFGFGGTNASLIFKKV